MNRRLVTDYFTQDHEHLGRLFQEFRQTQATGGAEARPRFRRYQQAQRQHIQMEETIMFPLYASRAGAAGEAPREGMQREHRAVLELMDRLAAKAERGDPDVTAAVGELTQILERHHDAEELVVYPLIDFVLSDADREQLFARLEEFRAHGG